jgi:integrase
MTPATLRIDKTFVGIRIRVRSGTTDPKIRDEIVTTLRWLEAQGDVDRLRMVQCGEISPLDLRAAFRAGNLRRLPKPGELRILPLAVKRWLKASDLAPQTKRDYENALTYVAGRSKKAQIGDLPRLVKKYREQCTGHAPSFRLARAAALSFLRHTFGEGRHHELWVQVSAVPLIRGHKPSEKPELSPEFCRTVAERLGTNGAMWWAMCITGMNPKEYWGRWKVRGDRLRIYGTKRAGRDRVIPLLWRPVRPPITCEGFKTALQKVRPSLIEDFDTDVTPKSGRDAFSQWMVSAGIPKPRRQMYLGHGAQDVQDIYERHELDSYLEQDAERMRGAIGKPFVYLEIMA